MKYEYIYICVYLIFISTIYLQHVPPVSKDCIVKIQLQKHKAKSTDPQISVHNPIPCNHNSYWENPKPVRLQVPDLFVQLLRRLHAYHQAAALADPSQTPGYKTTIINGGAEMSNLRQVLSNISPDGHDAWSDYGPTLEVVLTGLHHYLQDVSNIIIGKKQFHIGALYVIDWAKVNSKQITEILKQAVAMQVTHGDLIGQVVTGIIDITEQKSGDIKRTLLYKLSKDMMEIMETIFKLDINCEADHALMNELLYISPRYPAFPDAKGSSISDTTRLKDMRTKLKNWADFLMTRDPNDAQHLVTPYGDLGGNTSCFPAGQAHAGYSGNRQIVFFTLVATDQKRFIDWQTQGGSPVQSMDIGGDNKGQDI